MPECRRKVSLASAFLPAVNFFSPASAFRHQGQSGTSGHGLVQHCPALEISENKISDEYMSMYCMSLDKISIP